MHLYVLSASNCTHYITYTRIYKSFFQSIFRGTSADISICRSFRFLLNAPLYYDSDSFELRSIFFLWTFHEHCNPIFTVQKHCLLLQFSLRAMSSRLLSIPFRFSIPDSRLCASLYLMKISSVCHAIRTTPQAENDVRPALYLSLCIESMVC